MAASKWAVDQAGPQLVGQPVVAYCSSRSKARWCWMDGCGHMRLVNRGTHFGCWLGGLGTGAKVQLLGYQLEFAGYILGDALQGWGKEELGLQLVFAGVASGRQGLGVVEGYWVDGWWWQGWHLGGAVSLAGVSVVSFPCCDVWVVLVGSHRGGWCLVGSGVASSQGVSSKLFVGQARMQFARWIKFSWGGCARSFVAPG